MMDVTAKAFDAVPEPASSPVEKPDIYYFIFDRYQRAAHSAASSLNFDYLDRLETEATAASNDWYPIYNMFQDFRLGRFFKEQGYEMHVSGSWWEPTRRMAIADVHHNFYESPELLWVIHEHSLLTDIASGFHARHDASEHLSQVAEGLFQCADRASARPPQNLHRRRPHT